MRIAAFLAVLAHEMDEYLFKPTYILGGKLGPNEFLEGLANAEKVEQEGYLRSVLLRVSEWFRGAVDAAVIKQIDRAVESVLACFVVLIPAESKAEFESKLRELCTGACEQWKFIQHLDGKIDIDDTDHHQARPLFPTPPSESRPTGGNNNNNNSGSNSKSRHNGPGSSSSPSSSANSGKKTNSAPENNAQAAAPVLAAEPVVVWPSFYNRSAGDQKTLVKGYLLTASQVAEAKNQERAQQPTGPRRTMRHQSRTLSMVGTQPRLVMENGAGGDGASYQNGSAVGSALSSSASSERFLSQGPSGGGRKGD